MGLGKNVGRLMKKKGIGYGQIARALNLPERQPIWALVKRDSKKSEFAAQLAEFFKVPLDRLLAEDFDPDESSLHEPVARYDARKKTDLSQQDAHDLLLLIRAFLDTDREGKNEFMVVVNALAGGDSRDAGSQLTPERTERR